MFVVLSAVALLAIDPILRLRPTAPPKAAARDAASPKTRYCIRSTPVTSRIARLDCRTRAEWSDIGIDPFALER